MQHQGKRTSPEMLVNKGDFKVTSYSSPEEAVTQFLPIPRKA